MAYIGIHGDKLEVSTRLQENGVEGNPTPYVEFTLGTEHDQVTIYPRDPKFLREIAEAASKAADALEALRPEPAAVAGYDPDVAAQDFYDRDEIAYYPNAAAQDFYDRDEAAYYPNAETPLGDQIDSGCEDFREE